MRRVVITGIGIVSPLGCNTELVWKRLLAGECGITKLEDNFIPSTIPISIAAMVPRGVDNDNEYDEITTFGRQVKKEIATFSQYAISASDKALKHAKLDLLNSNYDLDNFGVSISTGGIGSTIEITEANNNFEKSYKKLSPYFVPKVLTNMAAGQVSIRHDLRGPLHSVTTACAAGLHSIGDSFNFIRYGNADGMLAGGTEASVDPLAIAGSNILIIHKYNNKYINIFNFNNNITIYINIF
jgi:3-oxoacyl-[acyl-carrier-protein] synthase II